MNQPPEWQPNRVLTPVSGQRPWELENKTQEQWRDDRRQAREQAEEQGDESV